MNIRLIMIRGTVQWSQKLQQGAFIDIPIVLIFSTKFNILCNKNYQYVQHGETHLNSSKFTKFHLIKV